MPKIVSLEEIKSVLNKIDPIQKIEEGFISYSKGEVIVPPVGELIFDNPPGDCHIKYGYIKGDQYYVIKIASGFYDNPKLGLLGFNGVILLFNQKTGELMSILLDEGYLTNIRTAAAGAVVAKYLAPKNVHRIGIVGPGVQGRLQLQYLERIIDCKDVSVWGRHQEGLDSYKRDMESYRFKIVTTQNIEDITENCNLIITCTPSKKPIIFADQVKKGTHITAMGSDTAEKQELEAKILQMADRIVVDSLSQADTRGECFRAIKEGVITKKDLIEVGQMIINKEYQRTSEDQITIADLTGVAVQDIQISKAIYEGLQN